MSGGYKLGRIKVDAWTVLSKIEKHENKYELNRLQRSEMFSRLFGREVEDKAERLLISYDNSFYVNETHEFGKGVYSKNVEGNFEYRIPYDKWKGSDFEKDFEKTEKKAFAMQKLSGKAQISLNDDIFKDGNELDVIIKNGDKEYICARHTDFIRPVYKVYVPVINGDSIELKELGHENMLYRTTSNSRNSYIGIPKFYPYILENVEKSEADEGKAWLFVDGEELDKNDSLVALINEENTQTMFEALDKKNFSYKDFISMDDCDIYVSPSEIEED